MSQRQVAYAGELLEGGGPELRYLHLGHWPRSSPVDRDLAAAQRRLDDALLDLADLRPGQSVLDVGCGVGGTLANAARRVGGLALTGLNLDPEQLAVARALRLPRSCAAAWVQGDACAMPLPDAGFDRLLCVEAAFHFASRRRFLAEARRVLRPGGRLVLSDIVPTASMAELSGPLAFALECTIDRGIGPWPDLWAFEGWRDLAAAGGFTVRAHIDASTETLPSYDCFQAQRAVPGTAAGLDDMTRAVALLRWLHEEGHVRVVYVALDREG
jgi:SAM-dependent methyltransferase